MFLQKVANISVEHNASIFSPEDGGIFLPTSLPPWRLHDSVQMPFLTFELEQRPLCLIHDRCGSHLHAVSIRTIHRDKERKTASGI